MTSDFISEDIIKWNDVRNNLFHSFNISEEDYIESYGYLVCLYIGKKWAFWNSFRLFLHSMQIFELDVSELRTPVMKELTKLQICNSFFKEIDCKLLDIGTVWLVQCRYTAHSLNQCMLCMAWKRISWMSQVLLGAADK